MDFRGWVPREIEIGFWVTLTIVVGYVIILSGVVIGWW